MRRRHGMGRRETIIWLRVLWRNFGDLLLRPCRTSVPEVVGKKMSPRSGIRSVDFKIAPCCDDDVGRFDSHFKLPTANALANSIVAPRDGRVAPGCPIPLPALSVSGSPAAAARPCAWRCGANVGGGPRPTSEGCS